MSQRLIISIAPSLFGRADLYLRDITQAYVQSKTELNRTILARPPKEKLAYLPKNTIMRVKKPFYGIIEAGTHWYNTYHKHHCEKLSMSTSTYDPCLLICTKPSLIGILGIQTDDTIFLGDAEFANLENNELKKAKLVAKQPEKLSEHNPLIFNGLKLTLDSKEIKLSQKGQADLIQLVEYSNNSKKSYQEQRARGAYLATICQPEAALSLSMAAQNQNPGKAEISALNKQLKWQMENKNRGLIFKPLNLKSANLYVFVDGAFANNKGFSSQIGFIIVLGNESAKKKNSLS